MVEVVNQTGNASIPIAPGAAGSASAHNVLPNGSGPSFQDVLKTQLQEPGDLKFSIHAVERMQARNIRLSTDDVQKLKAGVDQVAAKGGRESLVFMDRSAFLVSVTNRTVITAINQASLKENVFTNIDSAVVL